MKLKKILLVCSLFLAGGVLSTNNEETNRADAATGDTYKLVTDVTTLSAGDVVIIAASGYNAAMSTNQKTNNRDQVSITKADDVISYVDGLQEFTLEKGTKDNTFAFNTGDGYIYAASSSSNYLKTKNLKDDNASFSIAITSNTATIKAQGTNTKNLLKYNKSSSLFSCYTSGQEDVSLYEKVVDEKPVDPTSFQVDFENGLVDFVENATTTYTGTAGTALNITMPSLTDFINDGKFYSSTAQISGFTDGVNNYELSSSYDFTDSTTLTPIYTQLKKEITIDEALEICNETGTTETFCNYSCQGIIASIDESYNSERNNTTVTISDNSSSIKVFRLSGGEELAVGNNIKVTGKLIMYGTTCEFNSGATYEIISSNVSSTDLFEFEKTTTKLSASYSYKTDGTISEDETYELLFSSDNTYSKNNESKSFNGKNWTLNGSSTSLIQNFDLNKGQQFGTSKNPSTSLSLTSDESFNGVKSIVVNTSGASNVKATLEVTVGGVKMLSNEKKSVSLTNTSTNYTFEYNTPLTGKVELNYSVTQKAVYIKSVTVNYSSQVASKTYTVTDARIGFASLIKSQAYDENANYGILVVPTESLVANDENATIHNDIYTSGMSLEDLKTKLTDLNIKNMSYACTPVKTDANGVADDNGEYYQFGVIFKDTLANIDTSLTAVAYMELDGKLYLTSNETSYSLRSLAQSYIDDESYVGTEDSNGVLNYIVNYNKA